MFKLKVLVLLTLVAVMIAPQLAPGRIDAQEDDTVSVLAIDYMGEALESVNIYDRGFNVELTIVDQREMGLVVTDGRLEEYDLVLVDTQVLDPLVAGGVIIHGRTICDFFPELCPPEPPDPCRIFPWFPGCTFPPCPPDWLTCPPILFDIPVFLGPVPDPWDPETLIDVINSENIFFDPRNEVGFFPEPAIFEVTRPNFTLDINDATLVVTPACNYVMHIDEFAELGFQPIVVEGYQETPFNVGAFIPEGDNAELAAEFASMLLTDPEIQLGLSAATGLLPGNPEVLAEILPQ